ncbi:MAG: DUF5333 family protein [Pseudomonadota bacterium]
MTRTVALALSCLALPATAEPSAPGYYLDALYAVSTAERLAIFCPDVAFDPEEASERVARVLERLSQDGINGDAILALSGVESGVLERQQAFLARYGLDAPTDEKVCAAARAEMAAESAIGAVLVESEEK